jgi:predicted RNase H-like nuclease (RuvC/YqgF family)
MSEGSTERIIQDVLHIYSSPDDFTKVETICQLQQSIEESCHRQKLELKTLINDLTEKNKKALENTKRRDPIEEHEKRITMLKRELDGIQFSIANLEKSTLDYQNKLQELKDREASLMLKEQNERNKFETVTVPMNKKMIGLYTHVAPIDWMVEGKKCAGFILQEDKVKEFEFVNKTDFEICNSIWDMLY